MTVEQTPEDQQILNPENIETARQLFYEAIDAGIDFKLNEDVRSGKYEDLTIKRFLEPIPEDGMPMNEVVKEFQDAYMPYSYNFASPKFMGFPDAGNSIAAITGNIYADFLQQNLINQSFCSPSGTFAEINVIQWLRSVIGYRPVENIESVFDAGGIITGGGTTSNSVGMLLAREHYSPATMQKGVSGDGFYLVVPKGIGHYSVKSAQMWLGIGNKLLEVETKDFRYDLDELSKVLKRHKGKIMGLVAYAGDSRTMTVDNLEAVADLTRKIDPNIWLHVDACHGFSLGFSDTLRKKLTGIEEFDSVTTDPHKVMNTPYTISALLVKNPASLKTVSSLSDLIMQEQYAFGQATPFIGSKPWISLKLWFAIKNIGRKGFGKIIDKRHELACDFANYLKNQPDFIVINQVDINAVAFLYTGTGHKRSVEELNTINKLIHEKMIRDGKFHLHQFSIPDTGVFEKGVLLYPLRYMSGNPNTNMKHIRELVNYIRTIGETIL